MLTIRNEQMDVMSEQLIQKFRIKMLAHFHDMFPKRTKAFGNEKAMGLIDEGMPKARAYGIISERDVARFIDLMFLVRSDLDVAKETPWARPILNDKSLDGPEKIGRLFASARRNRFRIIDEVPTTAPVVTASPTPTTQAPRPGPTPGAPGTQPVRPVVPRPSGARSPTAFGSVPPL